MSHQLQDQCPYIVIPILQVRPTGIIQYPTFEWLKPKPKKLSLSAQLKLMGVSSTGRIHEVRKKAYSGQMSEGSIKRMKRAIQLLIASSEWKSAWHPDTNKEFRFKINFLTLTLPAAQGTRTDAEIRKYCLEPFLRVMRNKHGMKSYIWKGERQANGNLHFHITTDIYIHYGVLRDLWNRQLGKLNFVEEFYQKHGHRKPNSTDVHAVYNVENLPGYLIKYMTKSGEEVAPIKGKVWDCSSNLKSKIKCEFLMGQAEEEYWKIMDESFFDRKFEKSFVSMICLNENELNSTLPFHMWQYYNQYLAAIRTGEIVNWKKSDTYSSISSFKTDIPPRPKPNEQTFYYVTNRKVRKSQFIQQQINLSNNLTIN